ncbi:MAG: NADH-quinone oxidoreductase subunit L [Planctomycetaceae bacterium]|nr:NADH-quinone oxidoreductase subunit L [Planctomycetaceae bacterium]
MSPSFLLILIPLLPLLAALTSIIFGRRLGSRAHLPAVIGLASAAVVALALLVVTVRSRGTAETPRPIDITTTLWQWATIDNAYLPAINSQAAVPGVAVGDDAYSARPFSISITMRLDPLTATMLTIITSIGLLVAIYSIGYMHGDPGYPRFFALVAMFVFSMSMLVAASNFLLVYVFWEAVGVCSYLLIGFWFQKPAAAKAAKKAFLVNRIGDFGLAVAVFLLWLTYGTLDFHDTFSSEGTILPGILGQTRLADIGGYVSGIVGTAICLLLLLAACGKSAQLPLHVWLPDAMEGPTPASALIHAATMVTAGVYLIARCAPLYMACPGALVMVSIVGTTTALVAALIGTVQNDLKRVLAYSTISQLGYMFACLGTGTLLGFTAAIFHLLTHAFFKALLFLGAGSVMHSMGGVIDMRRFGGLRKLMPVTAITFLIGSLALAGIAPFAGFFSKDEILTSLHSKGWPDVHHSVNDQHHATIPNMPSPQSRGDTIHNVGYREFSSYGENLKGTRTPETVGLDALNQPIVWRTLFWMALVTAGLTAFYTFRAVFMTFTGPLRVPEEAGNHAHESPSAMTTPLIVLAVPAIFIGFILFATEGLAHFLAATPSFTAPSVVSTATASAFHWDLAIQGTLAAALGVVIAAVGHLGRRSDGPQLERWLGPLRSFLEHHMFIDQFYIAIIIKPIKAISFIAALFEKHCIERFVELIAHLPLTLGGVTRRLQSGLLQRYALASVIGVLAIIVLLAWRL